MRNNEYIAAINIIKNSGNITEKISIKVSKNQAYGTRL